MRPQSKSAPWKFIFQRLGLGPKCTVTVRRSVSRPQWMVARKSRIPRPVLFLMTVYFRVQRPSSLNFKTVPFQPQSVSFLISEPSTFRIWTVWTIQFHPFGPSILYLTLPYVGSVIHTLSSEMTSSESGGLSGIRHAFKILNFGKFVQFWI